MGTDKRERQKANRASRLEAERSASQRDERKSRVLSIVVIGVLLFGALFLYSQLAGGDDDETTDDVTTTTEAPASDQDPTTTVALAEETSDEEAVEPIPDPVEATCPAEDGSSDRTIAFLTQMPMCIDDTATYVAEIETDKGVVVVELDAARAPETVNNFVSLARHHFYDGVVFHRIIPGFMIQGGDAVGNPPGTGNPGYRFDDELPEEGEYEIGSLAMANSGPDTNGSQFFIVTGDSGVALPPSYSLFGLVTQGMDVVSAIEETGSGSGSATESSTILSIVISEK